jgi:hypothetical protein
MAAFDVKANAVRGTFLQDRNMVGAGKVRHTIQLLMGAVLDHQGHT